MKHCPNCQTSYTDDTLKFCLQDGSPLEEGSNLISDTPTVAFNNEETVMSSRRVEPMPEPAPEPMSEPIREPIRVPVQNTPSPIREPIRQTTVVPPPPAARKSNTSLIVLTALLTLLALGALGAWFYTRDRKTEVAVNVNTAPKVNRSLDSNLAVNGEVPVSNKESNANLIEPARTPNSTPTPKETINPETAKAVTEDVEDTVDKWKNDSESLDLDGHLSQYADTVDYYTAGRIGLSRVSADKKKAFETYDLINFDITNMKITPDATGEKATAVFDKEWTFEGAQKNSSGKVQQQLTLNKINGKWLITGEKDLKVYYVNNN
ncbi:MAG: hypothetical protein LC768_18165 [Acidobacteria bacterium]|nr:hypothetical protein [Acidobacteriota bacterium]MCA1640219.1 hypothetical protein [Acidobacteriota bacterium]